MMCTYRDLRIDPTPEPERRPAAPAGDALPGELAVLGDISPKFLNAALNQSCLFGGWFLVKDFVQNLFGQAARLCLRSNAIHCGF